MQRCEISEIPHLCVPGLRLSSGGRRPGLRYVRQEPGHAAQADIHNGACAGRPILLWLTWCVGRQRRGWSYGERSRLRYGHRTQDAVASKEHMGRTFYFCSPNCVKEFDADPHRYAQAALAVTEASLPASLATTGFNPALPLARIELPVLGLKWKGDGRAVEAAVAGVPGVRSAHANAGSGVVTVEYDPQRATTTIPGRWPPANRFPGRRCADPDWHCRFALCLMRQVH